MEQNNTELKDLIQLEIESKAQETRKQNISVIMKYLRIFLAYLLNPMLLPLWFWLPSISGSILATIHQLSFHYPG
jgi:hypothetical protein